MFLGAKVQNAAGDILDLNSAESRQKFVLASIQGLNPPPAQLNIANIYGMDGGRPNSAYRNTRNIVLTMLLRGDQEASRQELYNYFNTKEPCRFFFQNLNRNVYIDALTETVENDMFQRTGEVQVSLICPDPFFRDVEEYTYELQNSQGCFEFPFAIDADHPIPFGDYEAHRITEIVNDTQMDLPVEIFIKCNGNHFQPRVQNIDTGEYFHIPTMPNVGDEYYINTDPANLTIKRIRAGVSSDAWASLTENSVLWQLHPGINRIGYKTLTEANDLEGTITIKVRPKYTGV